jgi:hypothetical protein
VRLDVDGSFFLRQTPKSGAFLRRARVGLAGWMGPSFYYDVSGDFASQPAPGGDQTVPAPGSVAVNDAYLAFAPLGGDLVIVQAGQFDAPFTMENRTADAYTDFIERSMTVRDLGAPTNKEIGVMVHGADSARTFYYSAGVFNGDGPTLRNADNQADVIGRGWIAPFARSSVEGLRRLMIGASGWYGRHVSGVLFPTQTTAGGFVVFNPRWTTGRGSALVPLELRQNGVMTAAAAEVNLPLGRIFGIRGEFVYKRQDLAESDVSLAAQGTVTQLGTAHLQLAIAGYGELWVWLLADERLLPQPGLELPLRLSGVTAADTPPPHGLMVALRGEVLKEDLVTDTPVLADPNTATTRVVSAAAAINYWYGRRVRLSANYVLNVFSGTTENVKALIAAGRNEHEILLRFSVSL